MLTGCLAVALLLAAGWAVARSAPGATAAPPATVTLPSLGQLRDALQEEVLGDSRIEPVMAAGEWLFVVLGPETSPGHVASDPIDVDVVRRHPGVSLYLLWRAAYRAAASGYPGNSGHPERIVALFPGEPQVVAWVDGSSDFWRRPFDPKAALGAGQVQVDGKRWAADAAVWARAADVLIVDADRWYARYRPRGSLGTAPDLSDLLRARRLYEAALDFYPPHERAREQVAAVEARLEAASLFGRAESLLADHERQLREADRRHDELEQRRHSFYVWRAADLLEQSLQLDRDLLGAAAALDRIRRLLGDRTRPAFESAGDLEAELRRDYVQQAKPLEYDQARRGGEAVRGLRVHLSGRVQAVISRSGRSQAAAAVSIGSEPEQVVYVELPEPVPGAPPVVVKAGDTLLVWGELAGNYRYRDPSGRPVLVVRVAAAYVDVSGPAP